MEKITDIREIEQATEMAKSKLYRYLDREVEITLHVLDDAHLFTKSVRTDIKLGDYLYSSVQALADLETPDLPYRIYSNMVNDFIYQFIKYAAKKV